MSQILCVLHLDGRPVAAEELAQLNETMAFLGPDGLAQHVDGPLGMAAARFATTPEAVHEALPLVDGDLALVFEGRLDNREEIRRGVRDRGIEVEPDAGDGAHVMAAYRRWGEDAPIHLLGDYAWVLWDGCARRLLAVVDHLGARGLRWFCKGRTLLVSTSFAPIAAHPKVHWRPNEGVIAEWLCGEYATATETLWSDISQLDGGQCLTIDGPTPTANRTSSHPAVRRYWSLADEIGPRITSLDAAAEELRHRLSEAVACRMRAYGGVAVEVSGGWDSSTVAVVADELHRAGRVDEFVLLTQTFPRMSCDETEYTKSVETQLGRQAIRIERPRYDAATFAEEMRLLRHPFPRFPGRVLPISTARVILTGDSGNETLGGFFETARDIPAYVSARRPREAARSLRAAVNPYYRPLLPAGWRAARIEAGKPWLAPEFVRRVHLGARLAAGERLARSGTRRQRNLVALLDSSWTGVRVGLQGQLLNGRHPELRDPCRDLRVVRLAVACGDDIVGTRASDPRRLHDRAFGAALPALVTSRRVGADFLEMVQDSVGAIRVGRSDAPRLRARKWVTPHAFEERMLMSFGHLWPTFLMYSLETWLEIEETR